MKKPFNPDGVNAFQQELLSAPKGFRHLQIKRIRQDFKNFVCDYFDFSERQLQQIASMTAAQALALGKCIADSWGLGLPIDFWKDIPLTQKDAKDIILSQTNSSLARAAQIWIRYHPFEAYCEPKEAVQFENSNLQKIRLR
jgi:hypothetical protein